jgi:hypothetical protein
MRAHRRARVRLEAALTAVATGLALVTLIRPDWVEAVAGVDPDGHSGALEWVVVLGLFALALALALLTGAEYRGLRRAAAHQGGPRTGPPLRGSSRTAP